MSRKVITVRIKKGEGDYEAAEAIIWTNDGRGPRPDFVRRGKNRHMKNRRWKKERMAAIHQRKLDDYAARFD